MLRAQAESFAEVDRAWELKLNKKYNDLAGSKVSSDWVAKDMRTEVAWEAAYADQNVPHPFTGVLQRFFPPMGDNNHQIYDIWCDEVCVVLRA
jgi:hypothetical protein